jgi:5-methylthioadenosine/S-adenosylhomocysteine deaminase
MIENKDRKIIKNVDILAGSQVIKNGCIVYKDGIIEYADVVRDFGAEVFAETIDAKGMLAMPGLVNSHTHSAMTLLRNYADDLNFEDWLFGNILPTEAKITADDIYWGTNLAVAEMLSSGTTCFLDMYMSMDKIAKVVADSGIRANLSKDILKASISSKEIAVHRHDFEDFHKSWNNSADGRIKLSMEVHSVYLYDEKSLRYAADVAKEMKVPIHIHILESKLERGFSMDKYNMSPLEACLEFGILDTKVLAAHCVHIDDWDRNIMKEKSISVLHNPTSNLKLGNGVSDILKMQELGINVCLGTDGCASNNNLNMFEEMHIAALIHKGMQQKPDIIKADYVLQMATKNGAKALGFDNLGELKAGMLADIVLIDMEKAHMQPVRNEMNSLVYSAQGSDVDTVIVNGKTLLSKGEHLTLDLEKIKFECKKIAGRLE